MSNNINPKFTEEIVRWLDSEHTERSQVEVGAKLLLRLNRDKAMYQRIMRRPQREVSFLEYKLRRFLSMRQDGQTVRDVIKLDGEVTPELQKVVDGDPARVEGEPEQLPHEENSDDNELVRYVRKGIRPDHDKLPANIQAIWTKNAERWKKIKKNFEICKSLEEPCDRYEYLKILKETWYKYKADMAKYDDYKLTTDEQGKETK